MMSGGAVHQSSANDPFLSRDTFVWWDIEGCPVPETCDPEVVADNIKSALKCKGYHGSVFFKVYGRPQIVPWSVDFKLWRSKSFFEYIYGKDSKVVTDSMRMEMIKDASDDPNCQNPPNCLLISGERDFEYALEKLQSCGIHIMLAQPENISVPLVSNAKCIWLWSTLAMGGLDTMPVQTMGSHQFGKECLDAPHMLFSILNDISGREHSSFTPEEGKTRVVILMGFKGLGITTTCQNYANFHKKNGCKAKIVHIDTSRGGTGESHTGSRHLSSAVKRMERFKEENYDLIVVDAGMSRLSEKIDRMLVQNEKREMKAIFKATEPDLVMFVVDSSFDLAALELVYYYHDQISLRTGIQTGFVIRMSRCRIGADLTHRIISRQTPVLFIEKGENMDKLGENMGDFEPVDVDKLILGMLDWALCIDKFTLKMVYEHYKRLDQAFCPTHSSKFKSEMGILESMTHKEFESTNPNLILQIAHRIWSNISTCKGCEGNDGTRTNDNRVSKKQRC